MRWRSPPRPSKALRWSPARSAAACRSPSWPATKSLAGARSCALRARDTAGLRARGPGELQAHAPVPAEDGRGVPGQDGAGPLLGDALVRAGLQGSPRLRLGLGGDGLTPPPRAYPPQPV